ncbi:MAG: TIGR01457 family HAD-type hydrolase [Chloroflexi bacterium]|nr:TIGR01457 family HAD-type hydrolase [Chloroflexota bacterium]
MADIRGVLFDLDGVIYLGARPLPGVQELFDWLEATGRPYCLVTNNSTRTPVQYQAVLQGMGIHVPLSTIFTSALATAQYLQKLYPAGTSVYVIGEDGIHEALAQAGFQEDSRRPAIVCVGLDRHLTYEKLRTGCLAIRAGAHFVATNPDRTLPTEDGLVPGNGAIVAALQTATDVEPIVIGKPSATMIDLAIERLGTPKEATVIIGDRLDTDIAAGAAAGIATALVLTGVHRLEDIPRFPAPPDFVVQDLIEFRAALEGSVPSRRYRPAAVRTP